MSKAHVGDCRCWSFARLCDTPRRMCRHPKAGRLRFRSRYPRRLLRSSHFLSSICAIGWDGCRWNPLTPRAPDAAPPAHKRQMLEERWFDREDVEIGPCSWRGRPVRARELEGRCRPRPWPWTKLRRKNSPRVQRMIGIGCIAPIQTSNQFQVGGASEHSGAWRATPCSHRVVTSARRTILRRP